MGVLDIDPEHWPNNGSFEGTIPFENRICGILFILYAIVVLIPYSVVMYVILSDRNLRKKTSYIIVVHIGIADMDQLFFIGIIGGIWCFLGTTWSFTLDKVVGGIMNPGWITYTVFAHVLAFNRYIAICKPEYRNTFFSTRRTNIIMAGVWLYGFLWFLIYMSPGFSLIFNVYYKNWDYDQTPPSRVLWIVELSQDCFHTVMSMVWYAFAFYKIKKTASTITAGSNINENKKELKLLIQAATICALISVTLVLVFGVPQVDEGNIGSTISSFIWLSCCGNNCLIYLYFNKSLRRKVFEVMRCRKVEHKEKNQVLTTVAVGHATNRVKPSSANFEKTTAKTRVQEL